MNVTFLGAGAITEKHIKIIKKLALPVSISIASRDPQKARSFREKYNLESFYTHYDEAISSPKTDVLVIATPPSTHAELIEKGMAAKKHLIIEKPAFQSFEELNNLGGKLLKYDRFVAVAENQHYNSFHIKIKKMLMDHNWGLPLSVDITRFGVQNRLGWRQDPQDMPYGALHEGGVHWIHRLLDVAGIFEKTFIDSVVDLRAVMPSKPLSLTPHEDTVYATARHRSGLMSRLFHSWGLNRQPFSNTCKIVMEKGSLVFDIDNLWGFSTGVKNRVFMPALVDGSGYGRMWKDFVDCLSQSTKPSVKLENIFYDFCYMEACYRSIASGGAVSLDLPSFLNSSSG